MSMIGRGRRRRTGGFTLIELLVVVSIIALLISILLPSLSRAREQAKLTVCQSNISSVGKTFILYLLDLNSIPLFSTSDNSWCSWSFGGWSGSNREYWQSTYGDIFNIETADRPLSVYALKGGTIARAEDIVPDDYAGNVKHYPTEETPSYKCPSDQLSAQWQWNQGPDSTQVSAYDDVGSSYQLNFHWWGQATADPACQNLPPGEPALPCQVNLGAQLYLGQMNRNPARFVALMEDPLDYGLASSTPGIQMMGFHKRFSKHVTFRLDGHAEYRLMDSRHLHDSKPNPPEGRHGPLAIVGNWTVLDERKHHETNSPRHGV